MQHKWIVLRCAGVGALVGILPGLGGSVVDWIAYGHIVQSSKDRESFGKGDIRGVLAPESANNAKEGGALVPTLLFGIPGSGSMALLLGGLILIGIEPGPGMVNDNLGLTFTIIWSIALANVFGAGICLALAKPIAQLTIIRYATIAPLMIGIIFFAAYQASNDWGDLIALLVMSTLGVYMKRFGWSRPGLLIGFVLSDKVEDSIYQTIQAYGIELFARPIVLVLLTLVILSAVVALRTKRTVNDLATNPRYAVRQKGPQLAFLGAIFVFTFWAIGDSLHRVFSVSVFPITAAVLTLIPLVAVAIGMVRATQPSVLLYDADQDASLRRRHAPSDLYYLGWMVGLLLASGLARVRHRRDPVHLHLPALRGPEHLPPVHRGIPGLPAAAGRIRAGARGGISDRPAAELRAAALAVHDLTTTDEKKAGNGAAPRPAFDCSPDLTYSMVTL